MLVVLDNMLANIICYMFSGINNGKKLGFAVTSFERNMIIASLTKEEVKMAFRDLEQFSDTPGAIDTQLLA